MIELIIPIVLYMLLRYSYDTGWSFSDSGFVFGFLQNLSGYSTMEYWYLYALALAFTCITCMFYILIKSIKIENRIIKNVIFVLGKYSLGIYMVHMIVLSKVVDIRPAGNHFYIKYLTTTVIIVLIISFIISLS